MEWVGGSAVSIVSLVRVPGWVASGGVQVLGFLLNKSRVSNGNLVVFALVGGAVGDRLSGGESPLVVFSVVSLGRYGLRSGDEGEDSDADWNLVDHYKIIK